MFFHSDLEGSLKNSKVTCNNENREILIQLQQKLYITYYFQIQFLFNEIFQSSHTAEGKTEMKLGKTCMALPAGALESKAEGWKIYFLSSQYTTKYFCLLYSIFYLFVKKENDGNYRKRNLFLSGRQFASLND